MSGVVALITLRTGSMATERERTQRSTPPNLRLSSGWGFMRIASVNVRACGVHAHVLIPRYNKVPLGLYDGTYVAGTISVTFTENYYT